MHRLLPHDPRLSGDDSSDVVGSLYDSVDESLEKTREKSINCWNLGLVVELVCRVEVEALAKVCSFARCHGVLGTGGKRCHDG